MLIVVDDGRQYFQWAKFNEWNWYILLGNHGFDRSHVFSVEF